MKKRQKKKNQKKYLPIIADEVNLLTMTNEEREQAFKDYERFRERYVYRLKYKDLKEGKPLFYVFPAGAKFSNAIKEIYSVARRARKRTTVIQSINDFIS